MPGLFTDTVYAGLRGGLTFITTARVVNKAGAALATLDVTGGSVTFDEEWSPYVQANLTFKDPGVSIDPRTACRLIIDAGYEYASGVREVYALANLFVTTCERDARTGEWRLTASSDEVLAQTTCHYSLTNDTRNYATWVEALTDFITRAQTNLGAPTIVSTISGTSASMTGYVIRTGDKWWSHVESVRDMANAEVYCDETRTWRFAPYTTDEAPQSDFPATGDVPPNWSGAAGDYAKILPIITEASWSLERTEWANAVAVQYEWPSTTAGQTNRVARIQSVPSGSLSPANVGYAVLNISRSTPITAAEADAVCNAVLQRSQRRGDKRTFTARAAYWFRPRRFHRWWIAGVDTYYRVTRVTFRLDGSGLMDLAGRQPTPEPVS